jgi:hypothetical protein
VLRHGLNLHQNVHEGSQSTAMQNAGNHATQGRTFANHVSDCDFEGEHLHPVSDEGAGVTLQRGSPAEQVVWGNGIQSS